MMLAGLGATSVLAGGLIAGVSTGASAATSTLALTMTSGSIVIHGGSPTALSTPTTVQGKITSTTGNISTGTLTIPAWHESNTGSTETIHFYDITPGSGTGTVNYLGDMTYSDRLAVQVHITSPVTEHCVASPITVALTSTSAYNKTSGDVTLKESGFAIPHFSSTGCSLAAGSLSNTFSGNNTTLTLDLHGTVVEPPPPTKTTTTTISATPASPQIVGTNVSLKATVKKNDRDIGKHSDRYGVVQVRKHSCRHHDRQRRFGKHLHLVVAGWDGFTYGRLQWWGYVQWQHVYAAVVFD